MNGMTLKQFARASFWRALDVYQNALRTGEGITAASIAIHAAKGQEGIPKPEKPLDRYDSHPQWPWALAIILVFAYGLFADTP